jgi:hypothetical protein
MLRRFSGIIALGTMVLALSSCGGIKYSFDGKMYSDTALLIAAQQKVRSEIIENTKSIKDPVGGHAILAIRTNKALVEMISKSFERNGVDMSSERGASIRKHFSAVGDERSMLLIGHLRKARLFDKVDLIRVDNPKAETIGAYDYLIYFEKAESILQYWRALGQGGVDKRFEVDYQGSHDLRVQQKIWLRELAVAVRGIAALK